MLVDCTHHWMIDKANGPISTGLCNLCGEKKPFLNSWDSAVLSNTIPRDS
jgi:hypothetical protein